MNLDELQAKTTLSLHQAALLLTAAGGDLRAAEVALANAIEHGDLPADILRWATEQWSGEQLPGNIDRTRTFIQRADLDAWQARQAAGGS